MNVFRLTSLAVVGTAVAHGGCMYGPYDGETIPSRESRVHHWGFVPLADARIDLEARWPSDGTFYTYATTRSRTPRYILFNQNWYGWELTRALPYWAWRPGVTGARAEVKAKTGSSLLSSHRSDGFSCVYQADTDGKTMYQAQAECISPGSPSAFVFTDDYQGLPTIIAESPLDVPQDQNHEHSENMQGVASSDTTWFFTHNRRSNEIPTLVSLPLTADLTNEANWESASFVGMPGVLANLGYDHFGDPDYFRGRIYVAIEDLADNDDNPRDGGVAAFDIGMNYRGYAQLQGPKASWSAIDPTTGNLVTSTFDDVSEVLIYSLTVNSQATLVGAQLLERRPLWDKDGSRLSIARIQGGAFSDNGNLYLVSDNGFGGNLHEDDSREGGIYGFEWETLRLETHKPVIYNIGDDEELEGIDVRDLDGGPAPGISGQFHLVMLDNDNGPFDNDDELYFKHYGVASGQLGFL